MAVNGIIRGTYSEARAQMNFARFSSNVMLDNMDRIHNGQQKISEALRERLREKSKNGDEGINYALYVKEDEDNPDSKPRTKDFSHHHVILNPGEPLTKAPGRTSSPAECSTCANRKYQDGSDESDVSFQTPTHISPSIAASVILSHEREHVANAYAKEHDTSVNHSHKHAHVDSAKVQLKTDICPECGRVYFSGGVTNTVISYTDDEQYEKEHHQSTIFMPEGLKDSLDDNQRENLQELLSETKAKIEYFDDPTYDKDNPYVIVPMSLKDKLGREEYIEFLEEVTNLKIKPYDSPADIEEEREKSRYDPYTKFDERSNQYSGSNVDMDS